METKLEKLKLEYEKECSLEDQLSKYCVGTLCDKCPLSMPIGGCAKIRSRDRAIYLNAEIKAEKRRIKERASMQIREEMVEALRTVQRDDWEIVNIVYAEDDTTAVAFVKKGIELKQNMELATRNNSIVDKTIARVRKCMNDACDNGDFFATREKVYKALGIQESTNA